MKLSQEPIPDPEVHIMFYSFIACPSGFNQTTEGCFFVENNFFKIKNWTDAEQACQGFGCKVHLATIDTQQVKLILVILE